MSKSGPLDGPLRALVAWFERQKRVLPWRDLPTLYRVWISEIMLQQTQVVTVVPYFERFVAAFPDVAALAGAGDDAVMGYWAGLGYYSRARNLHRAARQIVAQGDFPRDRAGWLAVPGVGEYTAGAILSIALDAPEAILDGNVERVLARLRRVGRTRGDAVYKQRLWRMSAAAVRRGHALGLHPSALNQALMELGATVCSPKKPKCLLCPLSGFCRAVAAGDQEAFPPKKKRKEWLAVREEVHCVFDGRGRMLLGKRLPGQWRAGLWDFLEGVPAGWRLEHLGSVERKLVVTRHKITRVAQVWRVGSGALRAAEARGDAQWVSMAAPEVAVGSSLRKTLQSIRENYPGVAGSIES